MPLYALDQKNWIHASDANPLHRYQCPECKEPLRVKKGSYRLAHFYHIRKSPYCRLYSKKEDHYLFQKEIQERLLSSYHIELEKPFLEIQRIADLVWEEKKIIIEIQCSPIFPREVQQRIQDYAKLGYRVLWLLDDRLFNKKILRPSERLLRGLNSYFFSFQREKKSLIYDQCELFLGKKRVKKSFKTKIHLHSFYPIPEIIWPEKLPEQLLLRLQNSFGYFSGDLIHKLLLSFNLSHLSPFFENWYKEELLLKKENHPLHSFSRFAKKNFIHPYQKWIIDQLT